MLKPLLMGASPQGFRGIYSSPLARGRTLIKRKCFQNALCKSYNWFSQFSLLPRDMHSMTKSQKQTYIKRLEKLFIVDNYQLFKLVSSVSVFYASLCRKSVPFLLILRVRNRRATKLLSHPYWILYL